MKITCTKKEGRAGVLTIIVDEDEWRDIHTTIFGKQPAFPKICTTIDDLEKWFETTEYKGALQYALKRLSLKNQPSTELQQHLERKLVAESTITRIITECQQYGYLNDHNWLESFVRQQMARNIGPNAILMKLRSKGITQETAQTVLSGMDNQEDQSERIAHLLKTRYRKRDLSDYRSKQKVIASLIRKGFSFETILSAIKSLEP